MRFFSQEYQSGLPFLPPGDLPDSGTELLHLLALAGRFFTTDHLGSPNTDILPYIKQTTNEGLLDSTGNYNQYFVINYKGKESEKEKRYTHTHT